MRQYEMTNSGSAPMQVTVSRSTCKCLFYDYKNPIAPKKKETLTVTVDAARAKPGALDETVTVASKKNPSVSTSFHVVANIE